MPYSTNPTMAMVHRLQALCHTRGVKKQHPQFNELWLIWVDACRGFPIWPESATRYECNVFHDERLGVGTSTVIQVKCIYRFCNKLGDTTDIEYAGFEWYRPLVLNLVNDELSLTSGQSKSIEAWFLLQKAQPLLQRLAKYDGWHRRIIKGALNAPLIDYIDDTTD